MKKSTLVLNGDGNCLSVIPLSVVSWQDAVNLVYAEKANVLEIYEGSRISSQKLTMAIPSVIMLSNFLYRTYRPAFNKGNLLYRDELTCQYCFKHFHHKHLTLDHVIPKSKGGLATWENSVIACRDCNNKKSNKLIKPKMEPRQPSYFELVNKRKKFPLVVGDLSWNKYLGWDDDLVIIGSPKKFSLNLGEQK